jgi:hypothetical protein
MMLGFRRKKIKASSKGRVRLSFNVVVFIWSPHRFYEETYEECSRLRQKVLCVVAL